MSTTLALSSEVEGRLRKIPTVEVSKLTKLAPDDLRLLWVNDWYDGPLEAIVEHRGVPCLMLLHDERVADETPYTWLVVALTSEQRTDEERWHALYVAHVGEHWCFHGEAVTHAASPSEPRPEGFFDPYRQRPPIDLSTNAVVGWADTMPAR